MIIRTILASLLLLFIISGASAQIITGPNACFFTSSTSTFKDQPLMIGDVIDAFDPDGVYCGTWVVSSAGLFGAMPVYGDQHFEEPVNDTIDEGAESGDLITFYINGRLATCTGDCTWTDKATKDVTLTVSEGDIMAAMTLVDKPGTRAVRPGELVTVKVGVRNDGNGLDFFNVSASTNKGWDVIPQDSFSYADPDDTAYVFFDIQIPFWPGADTANNIVTYTVYSNIDPAVFATDSFQLITSVTDVDDPVNLLPGNFVLEQNYPNPFNPSTVIAFNLATRTDVRLEIFDVTGRKVDRFDLGSLSSGTHSIEYNGSHLASGVYFYRLTTETSSQARKMILMK